MLRALTDAEPTTVVGVLRERLLPRRSDFPRDRGGWGRDLLAGLTVAVVALPLALGFGIASGVGALPGLVTAVVAGVVAALFGGSNLQVSGPTGAMTVVLVPMVAAHGPSVVPVLALMAGAMVVLGGLLGVGRAVELIPRPVVEGFTVGIAVVIFAQQVPIMLGSEDVTEHGNTVVAAIYALAHDVSASSLPMVAIGLLTALVVVGAWRLRPTAPGALIGVVLATVVTWALAVDVPTIGRISLSQVQIGIETSTWSVMPELVAPAAVVALLAAIESLLSARVADGIGAGPASDPDRELVGQGLANVASGFAGGLPATGAIARTAVNVRAGASTRAAALFHGIVLGALLLVAQPLVAHVPIAALAAVLMVTAARMVERATVRAVITSGRADALVLLVTIATTVAFDLVRAVEVGVVVAAVLALRASARASGLANEPLDVHLELLDDELRRSLLRDHVVVYRLQGALFFGAATRFLEQLTQLDDARVVVLRLGSVHTVDATGAHALAASIEELQRHGTTVVLCGMQAQHAPVLAAHGIPGTLVPDDHLFDDLPTALAFASSAA